MAELRRRVRSSAFVALGLVAAACGGSDDQPAGDDARPLIVVTTNILGDVVEEVVAGQAEVVSIMPVGADPHDFQLSAQETDRLLSADALVVNGGGFEAGLIDVVESAIAQGVPTFESISAVETIDFDDGDHGGVDPHFFGDPVRMAAAVDGMVEFFVAEVDGLDVDALERSATEYLDALSEVDAEVSQLVDALDPAARVLVTNHEVFGYFADRYGFEVVGAVVPGGSTVEAASAADLAELAEIVRAKGVRAIFADTSSSDDLVDALASEVGDVEVVELYSESLGEPGSDGATYLEMVLTNAKRITTALG